MDRRHIVGTGLAAGVAGLVMASASPATAQSDDDARFGSGVSGALNRLAALTQQHFEIEDLRDYGFIRPVRRQIRDFLRANHKYPDFMEVGVEVWETTYDWHIRHNQPLQVARNPDGRYVIRFMFTNLIMRTDLPLDYVSVGFDGAAPR
jgi:hypothetical protein